MTEIQVSMPLAMWLSLCDPFNSGERVIAWRPLQFAAVGQAKGGR